MINIVWHLLTNTRFGSNHLDHLGNIVPLGLHMVCLVGKPHSRELTEWAERVEDEVLAEGAEGVCWGCW